MSERNLARDAIEVIKTRGWTQGTPVDIKGRHCLAGALCAATKGQDFYYGILTDSELRTFHQWADQVAVEIAEQYEITSTPSITNWNDKDGRTEDEVVRVLEKVAVKWEEKI